MQRLYVFLSQSEGGAPGYLSRLGEDALVNTSENIEKFTVNLGLNLESGADKRGALLSSEESKKRMEGFSGSESLKEALQFSTEVCSDVVMLSGENIRSTKTAAAIAEKFQIPVVVDRRVDRVSEDRPAAGVLKDALESLESEMLPADTPKLVLVVTSLGALTEWIGGHVEAEKLDPVKDALQTASENDKIPAAMVAGFQGPHPGKWLIDL